MLCRSRGERGGGNGWEIHLSPLYTSRAWGLQECAPDPELWWEGKHCHGWDSLCQKCLQGPTHPRVCTQPLCLPSISGGPTLTPFVLSVAVICFLSELKPSPPCCTEWSPAPSRLPAQTWDSKHTSWGLRVCTANLYGEGARGDRKNKLGAGTPWGEDPRNLSVPDSSLKSLLVSSFTPPGRGLIRPPGSPHPLTGSLLPPFSADPFSPEASPQKAETAQTGTACWARICWPEWTSAWVWPNACILNDFPRDQWAAWGHWFL